jgi:hypothetical protein
LPQLLLGLGEADIHSGLAVAGAGNQKLEGNGGLARAWTCLKQVQPIASPAAFENRVEADNCARVVKARSYRASGLPGPVFSSGKGPLNG